MRIDRRTKTYQKLKLRNFLNKNFFWKTKMKKNNFPRIILLNFMKKERNE